MLKKALAELIGTFTLILIGTGSVVLGDGKSGLLGIGIAFGMAVVAMAYSVGTISGAHMNPAVSLAMYINKRISLQVLFMYVAAQLIGALTGSMALRFFLSQSGGDTANLWATVLAEGVTVFGGFMIELVLTFIFVLVILVTTGKKGDSHLAGLIIGLTLVALIVMGGTTTGVSLNPARSFGPAVLMGGAALSQLWLYTLSTVFGGTLAALVAKYVLETEAGAPGVEQKKTERIA